MFLQKNPNTKYYLTVYAAGDQTTTFNSLETAAISFTTPKYVTTISVAFGTGTTSSKKNTATKLTATYTSAGPANTGNITLPNATISTSDGNITIISPGVASLTSNSYSVISWQPDLNDISFPITCPVLGIPLKWNRGTPKDDSATIDRINPNKGYIKGNIIVIYDIASANISCTAIKSEISS